VQSVSMDGNFKRVRVHDDDDDDDDSGGEESPYCMNA